MQYKKNPFKNLLNPDLLQKKTGKNSDLTKSWIYKSLSQVTKNLKKSNKESNSGWEA